LENLDWCIKNQESGKDAGPDSNHGPPTSTKTMLPLCYILFWVFFFSFNIFAVSFSTVTPQPAALGPLPDAARPAATALQTKGKKLHRGIQTPTSYCYTTTSVVKNVGTILFILSDKDELCESCIYLWTMYTLFRKSYETIISSLYMHKMILCHFL
jgi:hypothetical protein